MSHFMNQRIILTEADANQLRAILGRANQFGSMFTQSINRLSHELDCASIVPSSELPEDVVTLNSAVEVEDLETGELLRFTVVPPDHADVTEGRISVLAPIGMALLGYRVGDEIEWPVPGGTARMRIRKHCGRQPWMEHPRSA